MRTYRLRPSVLRRTLPEKGLEEVDIQVDIMDCLRLDVTASLGTAGFCIVPRSLSRLIPPAQAASAHPKRTYCFFAVSLIYSFPVRTQEMDAVRTAGQVTDQENADDSSIKPFQSCK